MSVSEDGSSLNHTLLLVGYGSLMSGYGLLAERRGGRSRLIALSAFPLVLRNARRGLAKPSSHGNYLAMDLEPIDRSRPITGRPAIGAGNGGPGALGLVFDRRQAEAIARREEYRPEKFVELIALAEAARQPLGHFLLDIARRTRFDPLGYRRALFDLLGYTSPGYIFHPLPLEDGRVAIVAIGSGFEGSGDPSVRSRRAEYGIDRPLALAAALALPKPALDRADQLGYLAECLLGGMHGLEVADLVAQVATASEAGRELACSMAAAAAGEDRRFLIATSLTLAQYRQSFSGVRPAALRAFIEAAGEPAP